MNGAILAEARVAWRTFVRRRTAVVFTFVFPLLLVVIFGALVRTETGLFGEPADYYVPGYLAVVVMFTPLSRMGAEVTRHRDHNRFEKLATTPLTKRGWLLAHAAVNVVLVLVASALIVIALWGLAGVTVVPTVPLLAFLVVGVVMFCGLGAALGRLARTQDGVIAASNTIALPMLLLAETFVPREMLPGWFGPVVDVMPLTPFSRGVRGTLTGGAWAGELALLTLLAAHFLTIGAALIPTTD